MVPIRLQPHNIYKILDSKPFTSVLSSFSIVVCEAGIDCKNTQVSRKRKRKIIIGQLDNCATCGGTSCLHIINQLNFLRFKTNNSKILNGQKRVEIVDDCHLLLVDWKQIL